MTDNKAKELIEIEAMLKSIVPEVNKRLEELEQYRAIGTVEELKAIRSDGFTDHLLNMGYTKGYLKAIDEFAEQLNKKISEFVLEHKDNLDFASGISVAWNMVDEIAEQMKAGGEE